MNVIQDWSKTSEGMPKEGKLGTDWERVRAEGEVERKPEKATGRDSLGSKAML